MRFLSGRFAACGMLCAAGVAIAGEQVREPVTFSSKPSPPALVARAAPAGNLDPTPATSRPKPNDLAWSYSHDEWQTGPRDLIQKWRAYTVSFDSDDDDTGDGQPDRWAVPHWVAYQVKKHAPLPAGPERPSPWITDLPLYARGIVPADASYRFPATLRERPPYDRGHMCAKFTAFRMGADADWNTHTLVNACPQHSDLNEGIWESLERKVDAWADRYQTVWVVTGPIFNGKRPKRWLGQTGEVPVAIPDAFFKIVIKAGARSARPDVLAFIYPNKATNRRATNHEKYLTSVDFIEAKTGLDFLLKLPEADQAAVEKVKAGAIWSDGRGLAWVPVRPIPRLRRAVKELIARREIADFNADMAPLTRGYFFRETTNRENSPCLRSRRPLTVSNCRILSSSAQGLRGRI